MRRDTYILVVLACCSAALAGVLFARGETSLLEAISFVTGTLCVWLTVRASIWNFPLGMINVATFAVVFLKAGLYADAGLQVVYFALSGIGWYLWLRGGPAKSPLRITRTPARRMIGVAIAMGVCQLLLVLLLGRLGGSVVGWDALTTSLSLGAQWLLDRKHLENWLLWIAVDVIYVPLYFYKHLYLTSALYAVFLCMACMGWNVWRRRAAADSLEMFSTAESFPEVVPLAKGSL